MDNSVTNYYACQILFWNIHKQHADVYEIQKFVSLVDPVCIHTMIRVLQSRLGDIRFLQRVELSNQNEKREQYSTEQLKADITRILPIQVSKKAHYSRTGAYNYCIWYAWQSAMMQNVYCSNFSIIRFESALRAMTRLVPITSSSAGKRK